MRIDGAGASDALLDWLSARRLSYSVGFGLSGGLETISDLLAMIPEPEWTPAYNSAGGNREGACVAEVTGLIDLSS